MFFPRLFCPYCTCFIGHDTLQHTRAPLLGAAKPVIKAHGSSKAKGIKNAIRQAKLCVANDLCGTMQSALAEVAAKAAAEKTDVE